MTKKLALVTGGGKGVGRGIAMGLANAGWDIAINYRSDATSAERTADDVRSVGQECLVVQSDVGYADQVNAMFDWLDESGRPISLLVNNAGVQTFCPILDLSEEDWDDAIRTNLKGTFLCTQAAGRRMKDAGAGVIINIGSGSNKRPFPMLSNYCASKGGIQTFTNVAAVELGPFGIRVNCVAPGAIEIERTKHEAPDYAGTWGPLTPMRRVGLPEDVAAAVVYLASPAAEFVTGQTLYVDGGLFTQGPWPYDSDSQQ